MPTGVYVRKVSPWNKGKKLPYAVWNKGKKGLQLRHNISGLNKKGGIPWNKGKKCPQLSGGNCHLWRGGTYGTLRQKLMGLFEYREWRRKVFERDDYTCQKCGKRGVRLEVDHIKSYTLIIYNNNIRTIADALICEELWDISNGRILCQDCHKKTPNYGEKAKMKARATKAANAGAK